MNYPSGFKFPDSTRQEFLHKISALVPELRARGWATELPLGGFMHRADLAIADFAECATAENGLPSGVLCVVKEWNLWATGLFLWWQRGEGRRRAMLDGHSENVETSERALELGARAFAKKDTTIEALKKLVTLSDAIWVFIEKACLSINLDRIQGETTSDGLVTRIALEWDARALLEPLREIVDAEVNKHTPSSKSLNQTWDNIFWDLANNKERSFEATAAQRKAFVALKAIVYASVPVLREADAESGLNLLKETLDIVLSQVEVIKSAKPSLWKRVTASVVHPRAGAASSASSLSHSAFAVKRRSARAASPVVLNL